MLSPISHDELLRQQFVLSLKKHIFTNIKPKNKAVYEKVALPSYKTQVGEEPRKISEIDTLMYSQPIYQMFSALNRSAQELMWQSVSEPILRNRSTLSKQYRELRKTNHLKGSLQLNSDINIPKGIAQVDIHLQPGGYVSDYGPTDLLAGALYEGGGNLYSRSGGIGTSESKAEVIIRFLCTRFSGFQPKRILDIGCSAGASSTPWALAYPRASVHGVDLGAGMLRYAHARAETMNACVHFHQMDANTMGFDDQSFDLVLSHNAMHEMSRKTVKKMFSESYRLLKPGGIAIHQDVPLSYKSADLFTQFERSWDQKNNNEPYWNVYATNNTHQMFLDAGFAKKNILFEQFKQIDNTISWFVSAARKPQ
jgi:ubiquinone/menaquinone biosynthesis C-methylase UbiE